MSSPFLAHATVHSAILRLFPKILLTTLVSIVSAAALATEAPLTLGRAQQQAVARSRQLSAQDLAVSASREMAVAAGQLPDPVLKFGVDNLPVSGADRFSLNKDFMTMRRVGVMQEVTRADKRHSRTERYEREADKSLAAKTVTIADTQRNTALAWLDRYYAEQMSALVARQAVQARREIEAAESAYRGGRGNQADIFGARSALAMVEDRQSDIQRRVQNAKTMLARWIGNDADLPLAGLPLIDKIRLDPATLDSHFVHHPQIVVLTAQEAVAQAEVNLAQANRKSDWSVEVAFQQRGPAFSNMISVGVSLPLQWDQKNRQDRELSSKLAMVEQAKAERDEMLRDHIATTRAQIQEWESDRERHVRYERELLPLANDRTQASLAAYRGGKATLAEVLLARRNELDVGLQALQLESDTARLWAQLNFLFPDDGIAASPAMNMNTDAK